MSQREVLLESGTNELEIIEFFIDEQVGDTVVRDYFGVNVAKVLEVVEAPPGLEPKPSAEHPSFLGTIPLRDLILPVVDLAVWLEARRAPSDHELVVITEFNNNITGFLVSGVTQIHRFSWADIEPPSAVVSRLRENSITGTVKVDDRFTLILDLEQALADLGSGTAAAAENVDVRSVEGYRVFVVDDSVSTRTLLQGIFQRGGFEVTVLTNGEEAWRRLAALAENDPDALPHAVVSDLEMPRMDGYTLTRKIKEDKALGRMPVVLFSSIISEASRHKGESVGADAQVTKPEFQYLAEHVLRLIEERRADLPVEAVA